jgi:hypothetical protein
VREKYLAEGRPGHHKDLAAAPETHPGG